MTRGLKVGMLLNIRYPGRVVETVVVVDKITDYRNQGQVDTIYIFNVFKQIKMEPPFQLLLLFFYRPSNTYQVQTIILI